VIASVCLSSALLTDLSPLAPPACRCRCLLASACDAASKIGAFACIFIIICLAGCIPRFHNTFQFRHSTEDGHFNAMKLSPSSLAFFAAVAAVAPGVSAFAPSAASSSPRVMELFATKKVFIDGEAGTTGLQVRDRLGKRTDIEIISPPPELRKDEETRKKFINEADAVILCALKVACMPPCAMCLLLLSVSVFNTLSTHHAHQLQSFAINVTLCNAHHRPSRCCLH